LPARAFGEPDGPRRLAEGRGDTVALSPMRIVQSESAEVVKAIVSEVCGFHLGGGRTEYRRAPAL
jgi:hypothetical protein